MTVRGLWGVWALAALVVIGGCSGAAGEEGAEADLCAPYTGALEAAPEPACEGRALDEVWTAEDGCNSCRCTAEGVVCTTHACSSCDGLHGRYAALVRAAGSCQEDADCQLLQGHCGVGLGDCYATVNMSLAQSELDQLHTMLLQGQYEGECAPRGACGCEGPPGQLRCCGGRCVGFR